MDDLKRFGVRVLILSGGEPLLRADIFDIARRAKALGFYIGALDQRHADRRGRWSAASRTSTSTTSASPSTACARPTTASAAGTARSTSRSRGIRLCRDAGVKVGLRFTMTQDNAARPAGAARAGGATNASTSFYLSHLNYAGRGNVNRKRRCPPRRRRARRWICSSTPAGSTEPGPREGVRHRQQRRRRRVLPVLGRSGAFPERARSYPARSLRSGAATPRASTSPTSTTSATCIRTRCGGTTRSATCASGHSPAIWTRHVATR